MYQHSLARLARLLALLSLCANLPAAVINVDITGGGDYTSIQPAIDAAVDGDEIIIHPGLYLEKIEFKGKDIVVRSTDLSSPSVVASTIIDAEQTGSTVTFDGSEPETAELSGLTIRGGGGATAFTGGGVSGADSLAAIRYNHILLNRSVGNGGGLHHCHGDIIGNTIEGNVAHTGQGGGLFNCDGLVRCNLIVDNHAQLSGGGAAHCNGVIENCRVTSNTAVREGGGFYSCHWIIRNCVIVGNYAEEGSALSYCGGGTHNNVIYGNYAAPEGWDGAIKDCWYITNSLIWDNLPEGHQSQPYYWRTTYSGVQELSSSRPNYCSDQDPMFVDPRTGDFRLRPGSPYIDSGRPETNYIDSAAGQGSERGDIGAYGGVSARSVVGVDHRPTVEISKPQSLVRIEHSQDNYDIEGEARAGVSPLAAVEWRVNAGPWAPVVGQREWTCTATGLTEGSNMIEARARDVDGRVSDRARAIVARRPADGVWRVNDDWNPSKFQSVQSALNVSQEGETVLVDDGRYRGSLMMPEEDIRLLAVNLPAPPTFGDWTGLTQFTTAPAAIDAQGIGAALTLPLRAGPECEVNGLAFCNGFESQGAGIRVRSYTGAVLDNRTTLRGNQFLFNRTVSYGAAGVYQCDGLIENNLIHGNTGQAGASYYFTEDLAGGLLRCHGVLRGNTITSNTLTPSLSLLKGGGLRECDGVIESNVIAYNVAPGGGGGAYFCRTDFRLNEIRDNFSYGDGAGVSHCAGSFTDNDVCYNRSSRDGGGLYRWIGPITGNTFYRNNASEYGGAMALCPGVASGNMFDYNYGYEGGGAAAMCDGFFDGNTFIRNGSAYGGALYDCYADIIDNAFSWSGGYSYYLVDGAGAIEFCHGLIAGNSFAFDTGSNGGSIGRCSGEIRDNTFEGCQGRIGGAIHESGSLITGNLFAGCDGRQGGAIAHPWGDVIGNMFIANTSHDGGAIYGATTLIEGNTFKTNEGTHGGAIANSPGAIRWNVFEGNTTPLIGGALFDCDGEVGKNRFAGNRADYPIGLISGGALVFCDGWIHDNEFLNGFASSNGGVAYQSHALFERNVFSGNHAQSGGAMYECNGIIRDNTFTSNRAIDEYAVGGAIACTSGVVRGNTFDNNEASYRGGAIYCSEGVVDDNRFTSNSATDGGAIAEATGDVLGNTFTRNHAASIGGAVYDVNGATRGNLFHDNSSGEVGGAIGAVLGPIMNNVIVGNSATSYGGGIGFAAGDVVNNTIWGNRAAQGGGLYDCAGDLRNNIVWANTATTDSQIANSSAPFFSCIQNGPTDNGNINVDPLLRSPATGDFTLAAGSPCIDAGDPAAAMNDACLPPGLATVRNDMGAYGGPFNCLVGPGAVTVEEILQYLLTGWGSPAFFDMNADGVVDIADVMFMNVAGP